MTYTISNGAQGRKIAPLVETHKSLGEREIKFSSAETMELKRRFI